MRCALLPARCRSCASRICAPPACGSVQDKDLMSRFQLVQMDELPPGDYRFFFDPINDRGAASTPGTQPMPEGLAHCGASQSQPESFESNPPSHSSRSFPTC